MGLGSKDAPKETRQTTKGVYALLQKTFKGKVMKTFRQVLEDIGKIKKIVKIAIPKFSFGDDMNLAPKGKGREAAKKLYKEDEVDETVSPAQRRARKQASLLKTMAKYGLARKMGIPASQVNQRRSHPTRKKS